MNCEQCQEALSLYLDSELEEPASGHVRQHLSVCADCAALCEDLAAIIDMSALDADARRADFDSEEVWINISKSIDAEAKDRAAHDPSGSGGRRRRMIWRLSLPQAVAAVAATVVITSLLTFVALSGLIWPSAGAPELSSEQTPTDKLLSAIGLTDSPEERLRKRILERQRTIQFWNKRIEARRVQWDGHFRDAFDRNLREIDQVVDEYSRVLQENPEDSVAGEMLDSALYDKEELLRAFSEL